MLWDKNKYSVDIKKGEGSVTTSKMHGLIQHLIVVPSDKDVFWSLRILDGDSDCIYEIFNHKYRLDDKEGLPIGVSLPETTRLFFFDVYKKILFKKVSFDGKFEVITKVREIR